MKKLLSLVLAVALCAPVFAQRGPKIDQTITAGDVKMTLNYTAISHGEGKTMASLMDKEGGAEMRKMMNERMSGRSAATFSSSVDVKVGDLTLPAGEYAVFFTIGDDLAISMNFKQGEKVHTTKLDVKPGEHESKRLLMCLYAENEGAGVYLSFGKLSGMLAITPAKKEGGK